MSVRVVARIRPLLKSENERDQVVSSHDGADSKPSIVKIPNPKNFSEEYSFQFHSVYGQDSTQQEIFENEGLQSPSKMRLQTDEEQSPQRSGISSRDATLHFSPMGALDQAKLIVCEVASL